MISLSQILKFALLGILSFLLLVAIEKRRTHIFSGDEPHYLVMTYSLIRDGDLDLHNDYTQKRYLEYYPLILDPHLSAGHQPRSFLDHHAYSIHGAGMAFLLVIPVWLFGIPGAIAIMNIIAIAVLILTYYWARSVTSSRIGSWASVIALGVTVIFTGIVGRVYADLPIALLILVAALFASKATSKITLGALGATLGAATWLHFKTALILAPLGLWVLYSIWQKNLKAQRWLKLAYLLVPWVALNVVFEVKLYQWFNVWVPSQIYPPTASLLQTSPAVILPAMVYDGTKGLLPYNPILWLLAVGIPIWFKRNAQTAWIATLIALPAIVLFATFSEWTGGYAPMGRYIMEFLPVLMPAIGLMILVPGAKSVKSLAIGLLVIQLMLTAIWLKIGAPVFDLSNRNPLAQKVNQKLNISIDAYAPHYNLTQAVSRTRYTALYILITIALLGYGTRLTRRHS